MIGETYDDRLGYFWRVEPGPNQKCPKCPKKFKVRHEWATHIGTAHDIYVCPKCFRGFVEQYNWYRHLGAVHDICCRPIPKTDFAGNFLPDDPELISRTGRYIHRTEFRK